MQWKCLVFGPRWKQAVKTTCHSDLQLRKRIEPFQGGSRRYEEGIGMPPERNRKTWRAETLFDLLWQGEAVCDSPCYHRANFAKHRCRATMRLLSWRFSIAYCYDCCYDISGMRHLQRLAYTRCLSSTDIIHCLETANKIYMDKSITIMPLPPSYCCSWPFLVTILDDQLYFFHPSTCCSWMMFLISLLDDKLDLLYSSWSLCFDSFSYTTCRVPRFPCWLCPLYSSNSWVLRRLHMVRYENDALDSPARPPTGIFALLLLFRCDSPCCVSRSIPSLCSFDSSNFWVLLHTLGII